MKKPRERFAVCVDNTDYQASLILGKIYRLLPDPKAEQDDLIRVIDESGEDYVYHKSNFAFVQLPRALEEKLVALQAVA